MSGNQTTDDWPEDLLLEILSRLPVKPLMRFRCTSKSWFTKIRDPNFVYKHLLFRRHNNDNKKNKDESNTLEVLLTVSADRPLFNGSATGAGLVPMDFSYQTLLSSLSLEEFQVTERVDIPFASKHDLLVLGPCNGVLCCFSGECMWLWNPAIREARHQHLPKWLRRYSETPFGFFHDPITSMFVVLTYHVNSSGASYLHRYDLGSSGINSRKKFRVPIPNNARLLASNCVCINGVYHLLYRNNPPYYGFGIISFDMSQEAFRSVLIAAELYSSAAPEFHFYDDNLMQLAEFEECLAVCFEVKIRGMRTKECYSYHIWVMKEYGIKESWARLSIIGPICKLGKLLGFWKNGALFTAGSNLTWRHLDSNAVKEFDIPSHISSLKGSVSAESVVVLSDSESLVSVNGRQEHKHKITRTMAV